MAMYQARWVDPITHRPRFRTFHSKPEAEAFKALPRDFLVFVERHRDDHKACIGPEPMA